MTCFIAGPVSRIGVVVGSFLVAMGCQSMMQPGVPTPHPASVSAPSPIAAGKYLVMVAGCNDCHTPEFEQKGFAVPEDRWLTGVPVGFRGPWGTTYPTNLRRFASTFSEDLFVKVLRERNARPPMPWTSLHAMSDTDLRAIYQYIRSLPITGEVMPEYVPPGQEPKTPYFVFEPQMPKS